VSFLYVALKPDDINVLQTYIPQLGYSEHRNLSDLSYPILFREKNNEDEYDTEMDDWRKYIGKYNYDPVGSSRGFHRDGMGIAIIDQTGTLYATYSYSEPGVDIGPVPCDDELRWTKTKLDELLNSKATLFSLWTDGPERISLQAIFDHFNGQYIEPLLDAQWIGRQNYPDVLTTLTASGESPTIFQRNLGPSQFDAMAENLDEVFSRNGLSTAFPHDLVEILSPDGHPYSVPVNIHRAGQLWYNKSVMQRMGINPANLETYTQWIEISRKFHDTGIVSLALQKDDMLPLFEVLLIDVLGKDKYRRLLAGEISWEGPEMQEAFPQVLQRIQEMEPFITLGDDPVDMVSKGMAATTLGTDEMASRFAERNFTDYGWMSPPGNGQIFIAYADSFSQWKESTPNPTARNFLNLIASKEGQELFNQTSGSICARMDCAGSNYGPYQQAAAADWKTHTIFPSLVFGGFVSPQQLSSIVQMIHELFQ
jgi:glucose/mannose transport system substrate-binding protein